jgi:ankyrin repeat protein
MDVARVLIERGADVTAQNNDGSTRLRLAFRWRQLGIARMLVERGVVVTIQNNLGDTPLHLRDKWTSRMLIERGVNCECDGPEQ